MWLQQEDLNLYLSLLRLVTIHIIICHNIHSSKKTEKNANLINDTAGKFQIPIKSVAASRPFPYFLTGKNIFAPVVPSIKLWVRINHTIKQLCEGFSHLTLVLVTRIFLEHHSTDTVKISHAI